MNRLVEPLLLVARLDAMPSQIVSMINLGTTIADVVAYLAPWAVTQGRTIGLDWSGNLVRVRGNADAITDAVRNLIENAVYHAPIGTEVAVSVLEDGTVSVADNGPGVPARDRNHVFERFWRGQGERSTLSPQRSQERTHFCSRKRTL
jgi:signal transduction histidine kinase